MFTMGIVFYSIKSMLEVMGWFNKYNQVEDELLDLYTNLLSAAGIPEAKDVAQQWLDESIAKSNQEGLYGVSNLGDIILKREQTSGLSENLERKRKEGVRDDDIRWWFNLDDIEKRMLLRMDEFYRLSLYLALLHDGKKEEEALAAVAKFHPIYGDLTDERFGKGDNRPLPYELKDRVNIFIEKKAGNHDYKAEIESSSTFNALVRKEIKAGNL